MKAWPNAVRGALVSLLASLALVATAGPALAHARYVTDVSGGPAGSSRVGVSASLNRGHAGRMRITLFRRVGDDFVKVSTKLGTRIAPGVYIADWGRQPSQRCRARARFTSANHQPSAKRSELFDC